MEEKIYALERTRVEEVLDTLTDNGVIKELLFSNNTVIRLHPDGKWAIEEADL